MTQAPMQNDSRSILIVDDEPLFRDVLCDFFRRRGYEVREASGGHEAFELAKTRTFDVIVTDIRMPQGDGVELLTRIRELSPATPIILLVTGYSELTTEEAFHKGAEALFCKPFERKALEETIDRLLIPLPQRMSPRKDTSSLDLNVEISFRGFNEAIKGKVMNIGRGGMFIALKPEQLPNVNDTINFKLSFSQGHPLIGSGIVRWARIREDNGLRCGCGVEFTYLSESDKQRVLEFLQAENPIPFIPKK